MKYMALIYEDEKAMAALSPQEQQAMFGRYMKFTEEVTKAGQYRTGDPLEPTSTATTVRVAGGKTMTTDGPYAETKEQLGGFYIFDCKNLDEAVELAGRICRLHNHPGVAVEVRPVMAIPE